MPLPTQSPLDDEENNEKHQNDAPSPLMNDFLDDVLPSVNHEIDKIASLHGSPTELTEAMDFDVADLTKTPDPMDDAQTSIISISYLDSQTRSFNLTLRKNLSGHSGDSKRSETMGAKRFTQRFTSIFTPKPKSIDSDRTQSDGEYEIDEKEQKEMELCQSIGLKQFVTVSCFCIHEILKLNHQSLGRFRKTKYFAAFNENVNLKQLIEDLHSDHDTN